MTDRKAIRQDKWLLRLMKAGLPVALICVASLWVGHLYNDSAFGKLFLVTLPIALILGFAYNIRYVMLLARAKRAASSE